MRTLPLTPDDLEEATGALSALEVADEALRDLRERCHAKGDEARVQKLYVALSRLGDARHRIEECFR